MAKFMKLPLVNYKYQKVLGYYLPNRFTINLGDYKLPITNNDKEAFTIFLHEYVHLLQNIFTITGWYSFAFETLKLESIINNILNNKKIEYPLSKSNNIPENILKSLLKSHNYKEYLFQSDNIPEKAKINFKGPEIFSTKPQTFNGITDLNLKLFVFSKFDVDGTEQEIKINNLVICESMAYIIEKHYGLVDIDSPDYPYKVLIKLFENTPLKDHYEQQIVILYLAMLSIFPDTKLKDIYNVVVANDLDKITIIDDFINALLKIYGTIIQHDIKRHCSAIKEHISEYVQVLSNYPLSLEYRTWLLTITTHLEAKLNEDPFYFIRPIINRLGSNEILAVTDLNYFLLEDSSNKLSCPNKVNKDDIAAIVFNRNLFHLLDLFIYEGAELECPMYNSCSLMEKSEGKCKHRPFENGIRQVGEDICDYGIVSYFLGVSEYPIFKT